MAEFTAEGRGAPYDDGGRTWATEDGFAHFVEDLRGKAREDTPRPEGHVPSTILWWVEDSEYLGRIAIRHRLTRWLLEVGGHLGYDVRPSARRRGHATAMLKEALPIAHAVGIDPALITCDEDNVGSRRVIEANGGVLADQLNDKLRFWVPTFISCAER